MIQTEGMLLGKGMMADVYALNGYAYKCFHDGVPDDFIAYEQQVQKVICQAGLPAPMYADSEFPRSIKMEIVKGKTLADWMRDDHYRFGVEDLIELYPIIHRHHGLPLPDRKSYVRERIINGTDVSEAVRGKALACLNAIPDGDTLCHNDFHFLNVMAQQPREEGKGFEGYTIIDWVSAMNGDPILDYARTYVVLYEFAYRLSGKYLKLLVKQMKPDKELLDQAIYACAVHRLSEYDDPKVRELIKKLDGE